MDCKNIPIFINSYNRLQCLQQLVQALLARQYQRVLVLDNASTYVPLLEYLQHVPAGVEVVHLDQNYGHYAVWDSGILQRLGLEQSWYAYTDPDVVPVTECPDDFMQVFYEALQEFKAFPKAGFGLRLDDIPDHYQRKADVLKWEAPNWKCALNPEGKVLYYDAGIDTTFALYRPGAAHHSRALRMGWPYMAQHLPWYEDSALPSAEELQYRRTARSGECSWNEGRNVL